MPGGLRRVTVRPGGQGQLNWAPGSRARQSPTGGPVNEPPCPRCRSSETGDSVRATAVCASIGYESMWRRCATPLTSPPPRRSCKRVVTWHTRPQLGTVPQGVGAGLYSHVILTVETEWPFCQTSCPQSTYWTKADLILSVRETLWRPPRRRLQARRLQFGTYRPRRADMREAVGGSNGERRADEQRNIDGHEGGRGGKVSDKGYDYPGDTVVGTRGGRWRRLDCGARRRRTFPLTAAAASRAERALERKY